MVFLGDVAVLNSTIAYGGKLDNVIALDSKLHGCSAKDSFISATYAQDSDFLPGSNVYRCKFWGCKGITGSHSFEKLTGGKPGEPRLASKLPGANGEAEIPVPLPAEVSSGLIKRALVRIKNIFLPECKPS